MHPYDVPPRRPSFSSSVPPARVGQESAGRPSATPIYDSLYAEWVRTFRTLPFDRSGEENLEFVAFGDAPHSTGAYGSNSYSAYSAGAYSARHGTGLSQWQRVGTLGRQDTGVHHVRPALPPAPRRGA
ncbi:hypothetical protein [Streptomyces sp. V3I7]|uniref:hypothetical protein n=1 Tax=Streptomyces sp. V3I7 TaxID=3042278 RepID=UPI0027826484|nr:hypothetical protein [Streptomyces sp. V3I7]MDQ0990065.1 hypothetical protein [Streptomyces sp. V3I7]